MLDNDNNKYDFIIIGAGIVGLSIAYFLSKRKKKILLIEKEKKYGLKNSSLNSSVIHAGIYYQQDSLKSRFCFEGARLMENFCKKNNIKFNKTGKLFIANNNKGLIQLKKIKETGYKNNIKSLKILNRNKINKLEPNLRAQYALYSKNSAIVDEQGVMKKLFHICSKKGVKFLKNTDFLNVKTNENYYLCNIKNKKIIKIFAKNVINSAGINSLKVAKKFKVPNLPKPNFVVGAYLFSRKKFFKHIIYQPFTPGNIIERVDATPTFSNFTLFGPLVEKSKIINFQKIKIKMMKSIKQYIPTIKKNELLIGKIGIRTKVYFKDKKENNDFIIKKHHKSVHLIGIESPGLTSSLAIGKYLAKFFYN